MSFMCFEFLCKQSLRENLVLNFLDFYSRGVLLSTERTKILANKIEKEKKKTVKDGV